MVWKARIFLGISCDGEVRRGTVGGVSRDGLLLFGISCVLGLYMAVRAIAVLPPKDLGCFVEDVGHYVETGCLKHQGAKPMVIEGFNL